MKHNKIVRDKIPEILESLGKSYEIRIINEIESIHSLIDKIKEEAEEFRESINTHHAIDELVDLLEIIYSLSMKQGYTKEEINNARRIKFNNRGGFEKNIFLIECEE